MPDPTPAEPVPVPTPPDQEPAPEPVPARKPDAILCSANYPPGKVGDSRHQKLREEFGKVLGVSRIYSRAADVGHTQTFITATPNDARGRGISRFFSTGHPMQGEERYAWADRGDGVFYGTLTPEAIEDERSG
jgi:hypothetical protein